MAQGMRPLWYRFVSDKSDKSNSLDMSKSWEADSSKQIQDCNWEWQKASARFFLNTVLIFTVLVIKFVSAVFGRKYWVLICHWKDYKGGREKCCQKKDVKCGHMFPKFSMENNNAAGGNSAFQLPCYKNKWGLTPHSSLLSYQNHWKVGSNRAETVPFKTAKKLRVTQKNEEDSVSF